MVFASARLIYRAPVESDAESYANLYDDPELQRVGSYEGFKPSGKNWAQEWLQKTHKDALFFGIVVLKKAPDEFVGIIFVAPKATKNRDGELGIAFVEEHRGKGYGTEAINYTLDLMFRSFGMHRVSLDVFEGNPRAYALYKRLGFIEEGRKRKSLWMEGKWEDLIIMGILEEEWAVLQK